MSGDPSILDDRVRASLEAIGAPYEVLACAPDRREAASFASAEETADLTGMMIGGVTVLALPAGVPLLIDARVMERPSIIVGGGNRCSKVRIDPHTLERRPDTRVADIAVPR